MTDMNKLLLWRVVLPLVVWWGGGTLLLNAIAGLGSWGFLYVGCYLLAAFLLCLIVWMTTRRIGLRTVLTAMLFRERNFFWRFPLDGFTLFFAVLEKFFEKMSHSGE